MENTPISSFEQNHDLPKQKNFGKIILGIILILTAVFVGFFGFVSLVLTSIGKDNSPMLSYVLLILLVAVLSILGVLSIMNGANAKLNNNRQTSSNGQWGLLIKVIQIILSLFVASFSIAIIDIFINLFLINIVIYIVIWTISFILLNKFWPHKKTA